MVEGRRARAARRRAEGKRFLSGRKRGEAWITDSMRERARVEARRLSLAKWYVLDRALTLALLQSAKGSPTGRARATALLIDHMREAVESDVERASGAVLEMLAALR